MNSFTPLPTQPLDRADAEVEGHDAVFGRVRERESSARTYADTVGRVLDRGHLARVTDTEGREYLDFLACAGTLATGHNHPHVVAEVTRFLRSGHIQQALDVTTPAKSRFLDRLYDFLPAAFAAHAKVQFCGPSGADAVEAAVKLCRTATGRRPVVAFRGAYHGMTAGALALTGSVAPKERVGPLLPDVHFLPYPYSYRCPFGVGGRAGDEIGAHYVERALADPAGGMTRPAAVIVEPVQGEGGVVPAPPEWLRELRRVTAEHDIPLIVDEVQTGFGRTGTRFAFEAAGIEPDVLVVSKAVGGGFPLSLVLYHERYDGWRPGAHAGTFRGNQIAMVAGAATIDVLTSEGLVEATKSKGEYLAPRLRRLAERYPQIGDVRGRGLMWGLELVDPGRPADRLGSHPEDGALAARVRARCAANGLIVETGGRFGAVLRLLPPLVVTVAELDEALGRLDRALASATRR